MFQFPEGRIVKDKSLASWPAVSISLLLVLVLFFPPGLITAMNLYLLMLALIVWIFSEKKFDNNLLAIIMPFGLMVVIGLFMGLGADQYLYFKDAWYLSNPAIILSVGYIFYRCKPDVARGLRAFVIGGVLVALIFLSKFVLYPDLILLSSVQIRNVAGTGYYAPALAFIILFAYFGNWKDGLKLPFWFVVLCFLVCSLAVVLCFSRTMLMVVLLGVMASLGVFARNEWRNLTIVAITAALVISGLGLIVDTSSRSVQHTFIGKLARSFDEMSVREYMDFKSINENWRGYETARALDTYANGTPPQWLFGQGLGAQVDLGIAMSLGGGGGEPSSLQRFIPVLHNGYAYLLVKGGLVAIVLFIYFLYRLYRLGRMAGNAQTSRYAAAPGRLLQAVSINLAVTTWVISGVFNKLDMFPFILAGGFLLGQLCTDRNGKPVLSSPAIEMGCKT